jgi:hypothetical protein
VTPYLRSTDVLDRDHPAVAAQAKALATAGDPLATAARAFAWVRDDIRHTGDHRDETVTCSASEVLAAGTGYCYAKSHLFVALCRANGIAAGLCYQRVPHRMGHCLHGLAAVHLPRVGWYRVDPRGNRPDIDARFDPPLERLAFPDVPVLPEIWPDPALPVLEALRTYKTRAALEDHFPDIAVHAAASGRALELSVVPGRFAVCRLGAREGLPPWAANGSSFVSFTRTDEELSIVCEASRVPPGTHAETGWSCLEVRGPLDFALVGVLSAVVGPLADAGVSVFSVSTFDTDYLLVREEQRETACRVLVAAGHRVGAKE